VGNERLWDVSSSWHLMSCSCCLRYIILVRNPFTWVEFSPSSGVVPEITLKASKNNVKASGI
jgi:hypothetical protein